MKFRLIAVVPVAWFAFLSRMEAQIVPMTNDDCTSALPIFAGINPGAPSGTVGQVFTNVGAASPLTGGSPTMCGLGAHSDVWFVFTAAVAGVHTFATCTPPGFASGSHSDTILQVLAATSCPPTVVIGCDDDSCGTPTYSSSLSVSLTPGLNYFVRVASWDATPNGTFYVTVTAPPSTVANDECTSPTPVFPGVNPGAPNGTSGSMFSNVGATNSPDIPSSCSGLNKDVWFSYTATATGIVDIATCTPPGFVAGGLSDTVLQVLDNACPANIGLACNDDGCGARSRTTLAVNQGETYLIRVGSYGTTSAGGFYLTIGFALAPPANDDCAGAIPVVEGVNGPFDNTFATNSAAFTTPSSCAAGGAAHPGTRDLFFTYAAVCDGTVEISTCDPAGFTGTNQDTQVTAYASSDCAGQAGVPVACNDDFGCGVSGFQSSVQFPVTAGSSYLVRVASWGNEGGTFAVTVQRHTATKSVIGPGCSDGGGPGPTLDMDAPPVLGSSRVLTITGAAPNSPGILLMSPPGAPSALTGGCTLYLAQSGITFLFFLGTDAAGEWSTPVMVPTGVDLECVHVHVQGIMLPTTLSPFYQVTSGLHATFGY